MPAPYDYDLRRKAIDAVKRGEGKTDVCRWLQISRNTLHFVPMTFEGSCHRDLFEMWLEQSLLPQLQPGNANRTEGVCFPIGQNL